MALLIFSTALFILIEINLSSHALKTHLEDLEDKKIIFNTLVNFILCFFFLILKN